MEKSSNAFKIEQDPPLQNKFFSFKNKSLSSLLEKKKKEGQNWHPTGIYPRWPHPAWAAVGWKLFPPLCMVVVSSNHLPGPPFSSCWPSPGSPGPVLGICLHVVESWCLWRAGGELRVMETEVYGAVMDVGRRGMQFVSLGAQPASSNPSSHQRCQLSWC